MKVTIEVECTPEEARRAMGLPDLTPLHDRYLAQMAELFERGGVQPDMLNALTRSWAPMSEAGVDLWRHFYAAGAKSPG